MLCLSHLCGIAGLVYVERQCLLLSENLHMVPSISNSVCLSLLYVLDSIGHVMSPPFLSMPDTGVPSLTHHQMPENFMKMILKTLLHMESLKKNIKNMKTAFAHPLKHQQKHKDSLIKPQKT